MNNMRVQAKDFTNNPNLTPLEIIRKLDKNKNEQHKKARAKYLRDKKIKEEKEEDKNVE